MTNLIASLVVAVTTNWYTTDVTFPAKSVHTMDSPPQSNALWYYERADATPTVQIETQRGYLVFTTSAKVEYAGTTNLFKIGESIVQTNGLSRYVTNAYKPTFIPLNK